MPTQATRIIKNCTTGEETIETYEIPDPTPEEIAAAQAAEQERIKNELNAELEKHYDAVAATRNYGIPGVPPRVMCALRAGMVGSPFQQEGIAFGAWMDTCNAQGYQIIEAVLAGTRAVPTAEELIAELPVFTWGE